MTVESVVSKTFEVIHRKEETGVYKESVLGIDPSFDGHCADHNHLRQRDQSAYAAVLIEIQVASALMHAWCEVNQDLVYLKHG